MTPIIPAITPSTPASWQEGTKSGGGGVRNKDALHLLESLNDDQKVQYEYFRDVRDKHIAHSVNEFENNHVKAYYIAETPEKGIESIGSESIRVIGLSSDEINIIENICTALLQRLKEEIETEKEKLLRYTKEFTVEDIKEMKIYTHKHSKDINISRRRK